MNDIRRWLEDEESEREMRCLELEEKQREIKGAQRREEESEKDARQVGVGDRLRKTRGQ